MKDPIRGWGLALQNVSTTHWKNYIRHIDGIIHKFWEKKQLVTVNELMIHVNVHSDNSDSDFFDGNNF